MFDSLLDKCCFNLKYKFFELPIYCLPLIMLIKLYIAALLFNKSRLDVTWFLSCKLSPIKTGIGKLVGAVFVEYCLDKLVPLLLLGKV